MTRVFYNPSPANLILVRIDQILEDCFLEASFWSFQLILSFFKSSCIYCLWFYVNQTNVFCFALSATSLNVTIQIFRAREKVILLVLEICGVNVSNSEEIHSPPLFFLCVIYMHTFRNYLLNWFCKLYICLKLSLPVVRIESKKYSNHWYSLPRSSPWWGGVVCCCSNYMLVLKSAHYVFLFRMFNIVT